MKKILLFWNTIRFLKPVQIRYQLWYRVKWKIIRLKNYTAFEKHSLVPIITNFPALIPSDGRYFGTYGFTFLQLSKKFETVIDWNFIEYGKLWNYNLQYFDYLHDGAMPDEIKKRLLEDFSVQLLNGSIKAEPYPVSIRLVNWILYYSRTDYRSNEFDRALKLQVDYLANNLEYHILANHLFENYVTITVAGVALGDIALRDKGLNGIQKELAEQILPDGAHYEGSPMYHSIVLSRLLLIIDILNSNKLKNLITAPILWKVQCMLGWLTSFQWENGKWANVNDATAGVTLQSEELFAIAKKMGFSWKPTILKESGYRKLHNSLFEVLFDVGDISPAYQPGHSHCDSLSICINYLNDELLVDTGISTYQETAVRLNERGTTAHNTVILNDCNQSQIWGSFRVGSRARTTTVNEQSNEIVAEHNGYKKLFGIRHKRSVKISEKCILITDWCEKAEETRFSLNMVKTAFFHFSEHTEIKRVAPYTICTEKGLTFHFENAQDLHVEKYSRAIGFNLTVEATKVRVTFNDSLITKIAI